MEHTPESEVNIINSNVMKTFDKILLCSLALLTYSSFSLTWVNYNEVKIISGMVLLSKNPALIIINLVLQLLSIGFCKFNNKICIIASVISYTVLLIIPISFVIAHFPATSNCAGPYVFFSLLLSSIIIHICAIVRSYKKE